MILSYVVDMRRLGQTVIVLHRLVGDMLTMFCRPTDSRTRFAIAHGSGVGYVQPMTCDVNSIKNVQPGPVVERFLDENQEGDFQEAGPITVTADEIIEFAKRYDPLPMHLSASGGRETIHKSLIASGVLTIALKQRLIMSVERNTAIIGAVRIDNQQFLKPVRPGDALSMHQICTGTRVSKSRPDRGMVFWAFKLKNQRGEVVLSSDDTVMVRRQLAN